MIMPGKRWGLRREKNRGSEFSGKDQPVGSNPGRPRINAAFPQKLIRVRGT